MEINERLKDLIELTDTYKEMPLPQNRMFEWNEVIAIVSEFVWRDVKPLECEDFEETPAIYRSRLNEYAEAEMLKIMYSTRT